MPEPGPGEVRVRIVTSGVNPSDWKSRRGSAPGLELAFPEITPNQDGAGIVDAVGDDVSGLAVGDRVWVFMATFRRAGGTAQEFTVMPAARVVPLPDVATFDEGATMGVPAMTAHRALTVHPHGPSRLSPGALNGRTVLVTGGAGAVGHAAIQLARWAGATVITTISSDEKAALALAAGAHHAVNYREDAVAERIRSVAPNGVDIAVEVAIGSDAELLADVLAQDAVVSIYATDGGAAVSLDVLANLGRNVRYQFLLVYTMGDEALNSAAQDITAALHDRALEVGRDAGLPLLRFPLERTADAHAAVEAGAIGKVLIDVHDASADL